MEKLRTASAVGFSEQQFVLGRKIPFSTADLYDLELIPGISDILGNNILKAREKILTTARSRNLTDHRPFELAHGVGERTAKKLSAYLALR